MSKGKMRRRHRRGEKRREGTMNRIGYNHRQIMQNVKLGNERKTRQDKTRQDKTRQDKTR